MATAGLPRASAAERERIAARLRSAYVDGRVSRETFVARLDTVYAAQTRAELAAVVADLPGPARLRELLAEAVTTTSRLTRELAAAWERPRKPVLLLPADGQWLLGRSRWCDCVVTGKGVSRHHARLERCLEGWRLEDCGSRNGTFVNGGRVTGAAEVRPGDELTLGDVSFVLAAPPG
jgi:hypothetical protein